MFGRIFGRDKDDPNHAACASCGRTLLAGEWTETTVDADGRERRVCSLCAKPRLSPDGEDALESAFEDVRLPAQPAAVSRSSRSESDAFWRALKDKDAEIARLQAQLARLEAERQELLGRLSLISPAGAQGEGAGGEDEPGVERLREETPAEFAAELTPAPDEDEAPVEDTLAGAGVSAGAEAAAPVADALGPEDTQPIPAVSGEEADESRGSQIAPEETAGPAPSATEPHLDAAAAAAEEAAARAQAGVEAEAASLTLLQRGVDLLNVSAVPRKIAETNEQLGLPTVHVGYDGRILAATFMWSIGWYRFHVDTDSNQVSLDDRGYDELPDLLPNAGVRADGTVQLAAGQLSRPSAPRAQARPSEPQPGEPEPPSVASQKAPEILSKSLLGQRSDDAPADWERTQARDFNWDR